MIILVNVTSVKRFFLGVFGIYNGFIMDLWWPS